MVRECPPWRFLKPFDVNWKDSLNYSAMRSSRQNSRCVWQLYVLSMGKSCFHSDLIPTWWLLHPLSSCLAEALEKWNSYWLALWQTVAFSLELDSSIMWKRSLWLLVGQGQVRSWLVWTPPPSQNWLERKWPSESALWWLGSGTMNIHWNSFSWQRTEVGAVWLQTWVGMSLTHL